jgi:hypothetical protein
MKAALRIILLVISPCLASQNTRATVDLSNLGESSSGALAFTQGGPNGTPVGLWLAQVFETGSAPGGYSLDSVQLSLDVTASPAGSVVVYLYGSSGSAPGTLENTINSGSPSASGIYTFAASGILLSPLTKYWVVATTTADPAAEPYAWNVSSTFNYASSDNWSMPQTTQYASTDGTHWLTSYIIADPLQFAVSATAVPEPGMLALAGTGLALLVRRRRK